MRSRSTVLAHILGSNPEISGYRELHHSYNRPLDLIKLKADLYQDFGKGISNQVLLDKILHNNQSISSSILRSENIQFVFLVREPSRTIKSIMKMGIQNKTPGYDDPERITEYYCERLTQLGNYAQTLNNDFFFIESDSLLGDTKSVLTPLQGWLNLNSPLTSNYQSFNKTGQIGAGDPSKYIRTGKIVPTPEDENIRLPKTLVEKANAAYSNCIHQLTKK